MHSKPIENTKKNNNKSNIQLPHQKKHEENAANKSSPKTSNPVTNSLNQIHSKMKQIHYSNTHQGYSLSVAAALEVQKIIQNKNTIFINLQER